MKMKKKIVSLLLLCCMVFMYGCGNNEAGYNWDGTFVGAIIKDGKTTYMGYTSNTNYKTIINNEEVKVDNRGKVKEMISYSVVANENRVFSDLEKVQAYEMYMFDTSNDKLLVVHIGLTSDEMELEEFNDYIAGYLEEKFSDLECEKGTSLKKENGIPVRDYWTFTTKDEKKIVVSFGHEIGVTVRFNVDNKYGL